MRKTSKDEAGHGVVRMDSPADLQRWSERFGVTPVQLKVAVGAVGPEAAAVQRYLQGQERPTTMERVNAAERKLGVEPSSRTAATASGPTRPSVSSASGAAPGSGVGLAGAKPDKPAHGGDERPQRSSKRRG